MENFKQINRENQKRAKEINLKELFLVFKRRFWVIAVVTVFFGLVGYYLNQTPQTPIYQTSSRIIIGADDASIKTLEVIVRDSSILDRVIQEMDLKETTDQLANKITVASVEGSQVVSISVFYTDPIVAVKIADTTAEVFKEEVPKIVGQDYIRILSKAKVNPVPINPKSNKKIIYGIVGGIVLGIGLAFLLESVDDRIRTKKDLEEILNVPVLGEISKMNNRNKKRQGISIKIETEIRGETIGYK